MTTGRKVYLGAVALAYAGMAGAWAAAVIWQRGFDARQAEVEDLRKKVLLAAQKNAPIRLPPDVTTEPAPMAASRAPGNAPPASTPLRAVS